MIEDRELEKKDNLFVQNALCNCYYKKGSSYCPPWSLVISSNCIEPSIRDTLFSWYEPRYPVFIPQSQQNTFGKDKEYNVVLEIQDQDLFIDFDSIDNWKEAIQNQLSFSDQTIQLKYISLKKSEETRQFRAKNITETRDEVVELFEEKMKEIPTDRQVKSFSVTNSAPIDDPSTESPPILSTESPPILSTKSSPSPPSDVSYSQSPLLSVEVQTSQSTFSWTGDIRIIEVRLMKTTSESFRSLGILTSQLTLDQFPDIRLKNSKRFSFFDILLYL